MKSEFDALTDNILEFLWENRPVDATELGIHKHDHTFGCMDVPSHKDFLNTLKKYLKSLLAFEENRPALHPDEQIDFDILKNALEADIAYEEAVEPLTRDSSLYPQTVLYGLYLLTARDFAPLYERMEKVLSRLEEIPALLITARENLLDGENIPEIWTRIGIETTITGTRFLLEALDPYIEETSLLKNRLLKARYAAVEAFAAYQVFLEKELLPRSDGDFSIGKELFELLLRKRHFVFNSIEELAATGEKAVAGTLEEIETLSKEIDENLSAEELILQLKTEHPTKDELLLFYAQEMKRAKEFVIEHDLVSIPSGEELAVVETPLFERPRIPFAAYMPPAPFEKNQKGFFWVTPVDDENPESLRDHSRHKIAVTALHEAYPGHHLQLVLSNRITSKIRRHFTTPFFAEGWALYCEEMMYEKGFYPDPRTRLFQLKNQLWRACRVVIDIGLHLGQIKIDEAVDMLVRTARLETSQALMEVKRYSQTPTQPMSYLLGKQEIIRLRNEARKKGGKDFDLRDFHDELLGFGTIPVVLIKERMLKSI